MPVVESVAIFLVLIQTFWHFSLAWDDWRERRRKAP